MIIIMTGENFRKLGFWSQLVLLALIDWATLRSFFKEQTPWYHWFGFCSVNILLLTLTFYMARWLRDNRPQKL